MTILVIFVATILFITLVMLLSITFYVKITDNIKIKYGILGVKISLKDKKAKKVSGIGDTKEPKKKVTINSLFDTIELIFNVIGSAFRPFGNMLNYTRIEELYINIKVGGEDAAEIAILYGKITASIYGLLGFLQSQIKVNIKKIDIAPNFLIEENKYELSFKVKLRIYYLTKAILISILNYIRRKSKNVTSNKRLNGHNNGQNQTNGGR